uniref:Uncharacterized protein n=1 Tax=Vespula pensylvanica TaxID=30213 RepID=A0A834P5J0_VESPE|nr:hypothetical protein H0235_005776 [Vespula pensylvanica]
MSSAQLPESLPQRSSGSPRGGRALPDCRREVAEVGGRNRSLVSALPLTTGQAKRSRSSDKKGMEKMRNDGKEGERSSYRSETSCPAKRYQLADSRDPVANAVQS